MRLIMYRMSYKDYQALVEVERLKKQAWLDIINKVFFSAAPTGSTISVNLMDCLVQTIGRKYFLNLR